MKRICLALICSCTLLAGCSTDNIPGWLKPYRPDIHQGNVITSEMLDSLQVGMTKNQVIFLLGSPTLRSVFHEDEWGYTYYLNPRFGKTQLRKMTVTFDEDGRVSKIEADEMPDETDADLQILGERARPETLKKRAAAKAAAISDAEETATFPVTVESPAEETAALSEAEEKAVEEAVEHPNTIETESVGEVPETEETNDD